MAKTKDTVFGAAGSAKPYVERALHDEELRENVRTAFAAARQIYDELAGKRGVTGLAQKVATDKDIQDNLRTAIEELRHAANRVQGRQEASTSRNTALLMAGIALGLLFNPVTGPATRRWLRSMVGGQSEDTFGFDSSNGGAAPAA